MLSDFSGLSWQSGDEKDQSSLEHTPDERFSLSQSLNEVAEEYRTPQPKPNYTDIFYKIWLAEPSWSQIILTQAGWKTVKGSGKKKVPLTLGSVESCYRRGNVIGKRFGKLTNYLLIDIDINSPFHPRNQGYRAILEVMERLGLCRYLIVRSSTSGGIHLYFPLPESVNAYALANTAHNALTASGIHIISGQCELFPNKKAFNAEHHGHRLPLQDGSFLLDDDFCPISNYKADFVIRWESAATHQDMVRLKQALAGKAVLASPLPTAAARHALPPIAWTRFAQSNDIMCELVNYGDRYAGHKTVADLAAWIKVVAPQLPGYQKFASPKSKQDIEHGTWPTRWSESHFASAWQYKNGGSDHNGNKARDAKWRIFAALERFCAAPDIGITKLWKNISSISASCFNIGVGWKTFNKHREEVLAYVKKVSELGLSKEFVEDVNSFSSESVSVQETEPELAEKKGIAQLSTLRCVIAIYGSAFASFYTPKIRALKGGQAKSKRACKSPAESTLTTTVSNSLTDDQIQDGKCQPEPDKSPQVERPKLTVGQAVRIVMPGGSLNGVETRIQAQVLNVLGQPVYQLDYQRQGQTVSLPAECLQAIKTEVRVLPGEQVIRATAAQLVQVLGKTCPFVGPGLWTVKREDLPPTAWGQLSKLIAET